MIWDDVNMSDGGHFQFYGAVRPICLMLQCTIARAFEHSSCAVLQVFDTIVHGLSTYRLGGIMGLGGGNYFDPTHR
eukprot:SAG31_NODE_4439_length_3228_cov_1.409076_5_plen_76_part_00